MIFKFSITYTKLISRIKSWLAQFTNLCSIAVLVNGGDDIFLAGSIIKKKIKKRKERKSPVLLERLEYPLSKILETTY